MKTIFTADSVPILNFSRMPDLHNSIIPPEAHADFPDELRVTYGKFEIEHVAGKAKLRRVGNVLLADMTLRSVMPDVNKSEKMIRLLYPAVTIIVLEAMNETIFKFKVTELFLTPDRNVDTSIERLGHKINRISRSGLH